MDNCNLNTIDHNILFNPISRLGIHTNKHDSLTSEADIVVMPTATEGPTRLGLRMRRGLPLLKSLDLDKEETRDPNTFSGSSVFCKNITIFCFQRALKNIQAYVFDISKLHTPFQVYATECCNPLRSLDIPGASSQPYH